MLTAIKVSEQGFSHKAINKPCQDSICAGLNNKKTYSIIAVADGHGGEKYFRSQIGSNYAVSIAKDLMVKFVGNLKGISISSNRDSLLEENAKLIEARIVYKWREQVKNDFLANKLTQEEKELCNSLKLDINTDEQIYSIYGTTLLVSLYCPAFPFFLSIQIGDGLTFALDCDDKDYLPIPEDESLGFGLTTSLCSKNATDHFRHFYNYRKLNALTVCTDGVADSFAKDKYGDFIRKIKNNLLEHDEKSVNIELQDFLPKLSEQGSGDDVSLAGIFDIPKIKKDIKK